MQLSGPVLLYSLFAFCLISGAEGQSPSDGQAVSGSAADPSSPGTQQSVTLQARPTVPVGPDYRIGAGDVLRVSVFEEPQFSTSAVVRPDGKISIPLISDLPVAGMTPDAAQRQLAEQLSRFIKHPRVTVIIEEIHSRIVYVTGEVQHPGAYPLISPMNVVQLIARAGGPTEFAKRKEVYVLHQEGGVRIKVNYQMVLAGKHLEENIGLIPGDTVVVP
ncbi:polysaccharide biosynthesis/export family protein [Acidisarcina polymorpha]|uniref:polysaccharide biosynthesis/export family protein n=1 Tax=Acidisarcina polymorpha TaxID=2211140 RepID=UPI000DEF554D|nr:polysaccharide biosynthesis/export family protein [Acidisarcina polymorpha]